MSVHSNRVRFTPAARAKSSPNWSTHLATTSSTSAITSLEIFWNPRKKEDGRPSSWYQKSPQILPFGQKRGVKKQWILIEYTLEQNIILIVKRENKTKALWEKISVSIYWFVNMITQIPLFFSTKNSFLANRCVLVKLWGESDVFCFFPSELFWLWKGLGVTYPRSWKTRLTDPRVHQIVLDKKNHNHNFKVSKALLIVCFKFCHRIDCHFLEHERSKAKAIFF